MAEILLDEQAPAAAPASGKGVLYPDSSVSKMVYKDDSGRAYTQSGDIRNWSVAASASMSADTYLAGSSLLIPAHLMQVGTTFRWSIVMTKAAGTAAPVWNIRVGTAGAIGDTARVVFTQVALQTAVADTAWIDIVATLRNTGAAGVLAGGLKMSHVLAATGFSTLDHNVQQVTSAGFDTTVPNTIVGLSVNPGAAGAWVAQYVHAEAMNI